MSTSALKKATLLRRDVAVKAVTACGQYRVTAANTTTLLRETIQRHGLTRGPVTPMLGHTITLTNLLASFLEREERVSCEVATPHGIPMCESLALGESRAFVNAAQEEGGVEYMRVRRVLYGKTRPMESVTVAPEPGALSLRPHAEHFFLQSDGVPTAVLLMTYLDGEAVVASGGVMLQPIAHDQVRENTVPAPVAALQAGFAAIDDRTADQAFTDALRRRFEAGFVCHDLLGLATGDWTGAAAATAHARIVSADCGAAAEAGRQAIAAAPVIDSFAAMRKAHTDADAAAIRAAQEAGLPLPPPLRPTMTSEEKAIADAFAALPTAASPYAAHGVTSACDAVQTQHIDDPYVSAAVHVTREAMPLRLSVAAAAVERTPLDFHCRCSVAGFMQGLRSIGHEGCLQRRREAPDLTFRCQYCGKEMAMGEKDWDTLLRSFDAAPTGAA